MSPKPTTAAKAVEGLRRLAAEKPIASIVRGACMEPVLSDGDNVIVESRSVYWPGDILVFRAGSDLRAHRLLGYAPTRHGMLAITRPDASIDAWDAPIRADLIIGRVIALASGRAVRISGAERLRAVGRFLRLATRRLLRADL